MASVDHLTVRECPQRRLAEFPVITVPAITLEGDANGAPHPDPASYAARLPASTGTG
jgi:hypothetical protein